MSEHEDAQLIANAVSAELQKVMEPLGAMTRIINRVSDQLKELDTRVVRLEEAPHPTEIKRLAALVNEQKNLVDELRMWRNQVDGAMKLFNQVRLWGPIAVAALGGLIVWLNVGPTP